MKEYQDQQKSCSNLQEQCLINRSKYIKIRWTPHQDQKLLNLIQKYGYKWPIISKKMGNRSTKSCRQRWINNLNPNISWDKFNLYEEWLLFLGLLILGPKWSQIAKLFPDRTDNQLKNHSRTRPYLIKLKYFKTQIKKIIIKNGLYQIMSDVIENN